MDVNFINPKYTDENPYQVTKTPGYINDQIKTELIKDTSNKNLSDVKQNFEQIVGQGTISEDSITVTLISDDNHNNEWQMLITYGNDCMIVEGGQNYIAKDLSNLLAGTVGEGTDTHIEVISFAELNSRCTSGSDWEKTINKMLTKGNKMWSILSVEGTETELENKSVELIKNRTTVNNQQEVIDEILKKYGYYDADIKSSGSLEYIWNKKNGDNYDQYKLKYNTVTTNSTAGDTSLKYTVTKTTYGNNYSTGETMVSSSYTLQRTISTWYKALRAIALVGLLSVLVYIGIRILISSTGQEKAKYKKMIVDWVAAICILFVLQYIMAFIIDIVEKISNILKTSLIGSQGEDILMSNLRSSVGVSEDFELMFPELIMYLVLVIYTIMFTIQYVKRLIYMGFFTMIAPLIALTYPLDRIKDGQAQAFTIWLREYIFNALLQPLHLLIYYIFVGSAMDLATTNPIYAIIVIGFMLPAEKFFRKMFGFDKSTSTSQLGAAAGGALVMNAVNKLGQKAGKAATGKTGGDSGGSGGTSGSTTRYASTPDNGIGGGKPKNLPKDKDGNPIGAAGSAFGQNFKGAEKSGKMNLLNGAKTLGGHYNQFNRPKAIRNAKALGRGVRKGLVGAAGAATLGTVGLAAGVATGDFSKAVQYTAAGAGAGYIGANNLGDKATDLEKKNREIFKEGAFGTAEYNRRNSIKELTNDHDFNNLCKTMGVKNQKGREVLIRQFHENGITKSEDIKKAMNAGVNTGATREQVMAAAKIRREADRLGYKKKDVMATISEDKAKDLVDLMW